jgi:DNA-binding CsgD family transcriptional regulator
MLIPLRGSSHLFYHGDWGTVLGAVLGFLSEPVSPGPPLTGRQLEVAGLVAEGLTKYSIARRLSVAPRTAEAHVQNIRRKPRSQPASSARQKERLSSQEGQPRLAWRRLARWRR